MADGLFSKLAAGDTLFHEGDVAECAYLIESGQVEVRVGRDGESDVIATLGPGEILGEMGVLDESPRMASAVAIEDTWLLVVSRDRLTERLSQSDPIVRFLVKALLDRLRGQESTDVIDGKFDDTSLSGFMLAGRDKIRLESDLKHALENDELDIVYQPLLDISTRMVAGFEALTRWHHPERGTMSPESFISLAEETHLIVPVGLYAFKTASRELQRLSKRAGRPLFMSINVSARQIADRRFFDDAVAYTNAIGLDRQQIKLELTESMVIDVDATEIWLKQARKHHFQLSLDDFGVGYSNLTNLYRLPFDNVKLDKSFLRNVHDDHFAETVLAAISRLTRSLGLELVVEGVETAEDLELIELHGCSLAQGYYVGRPMPPEEAAKIL